jgi:hypothetical protein
MRPFAFAAVAAASLLAALAGCVERTITITTEPPGALVWLNDREVGRSPVDVKFDYYGTYDVRLEREGYERQMTTGKADAPGWEFIGLDLVAELLPIPLHSRVRWNYVLEPERKDRDGLVARAELLREEVSPTPTAAPAPASAPAPETPKPAPESAPAP